MSKKLNVVINQLNVHHLEIVNNEHLYGPGERLLIFFQGCSLHCKGCVNRHIWPFGKGKIIEDDAIIAILKKHPKCGVTLHGGEPLDQADVLINLIKKIKKINRTIILFTGYLKNELNGTQKKIWDLADLVKSGPFVKEKLNYYLQFRGSTNQRIYRHKGPYKNYRIKDGKTSAILTFDDKGEMSIKGFYSKDIKKIINFS